ncbi:MAG: bifunctional metallophosphatase/5'-nucleotidase [Candidatus Onthomonas sp.]
MKRRLRFLSSVLALLLLLPLLPTARAADQEVSVISGMEGQYQSAVLFTQDMHEHFLPVSDGAGGTYGGLARLSTLLKQERAKYPDALTVDAGDFSMGSLFQSIYAAEAPELRLMGRLGFDATTLGNHEFDYRPEGLASMLWAAVDSGDPLPALVDANYLPRTPEEEGYSDTDAMVWEAMDAYGVRDYVTLSRGGVTYAIFGIFGEEADADAPMSGMVLKDPIETAQATVDKIKAEVQTEEPLFIICLSHCGTATGGGSEDEKLAKAVDGIDLLISGHSHVVLEQPIQVGETLIVSGGCYTQYLGEILVFWNADGEKTGYEYRLLPLGDAVEEDLAIAWEIQDYQALVEEEYLTQFGYTGYDQVLSENDIVFDTIDDLYANHRESGLGNLIADAYRYAVEQAEGGTGDRVDFALTACGVVRDTVPLGEVTVSDAFNVSSLGIGADGVAGYPLVSVYLTGKDVKNAFEVDASITDLMPAAQLYFSGMTFTWNPYRMIFNKVESCGQLLDDGSVVEIEDDKLYRVVTGLYCGQMLGAVEEQSFGILSITPRNADGTPIDIDRLEDYIVHDETGAEVKEWAAIASYLQSFDGSVPVQYAGSEGRKVEHASLNPVALFRNCSSLTFGILCLILALILLLILGIRRLSRWIRRRRRPDLRQRGGGKPYTGGIRPKGGQISLAQPESASRRRFRVSNRRYGPSQFQKQVTGYTGSRRSRPVRKPKSSFWGKTYRGRR